MEAVTGNTLLSEREGFPKCFAVNGCLTDDRMIMSASLSPPANVTDAKDKCGCYVTVPGNVNNI